MRYWLVMPAAGSGSRFGAGGPKQYAPLAGRPDRESVGEGKRVEFGGCRIIKKKKKRGGELGSLDELVAGAELREAGGASIGRAFAALAMAVRWVARQDMSEWRARCVAGGDASS